MDPMSLLLAGCLTMGAGAPPTATTDAGGMVHTRDRAFRIPIDLTELERQQVAAVRLFVSPDEGRTWKRYREDSPRKTTLTFRADQDGVYWFALALIGQDGLQSPSDARLLLPGLKVAVDSQKPTVALEPIRSKSGRRGVRWKLSDNAAVEDLSPRLALWDDKLKTWRPRTVTKPRDQLAWFDTGESISKVQLAVRDPAGNESVGQVEISGDRFRVSSPAAFALSLVPEEDALMAAAAASMDRRRTSSASKMLASGERFAANADPMAPPHSMKSLGSRFDDHQVAPVANEPMTRPTARTNPPENTPIDAVPAPPMIAEHGAPAPPTALEPYSPPLPTGRPKQRRMGHPSAMARGAEKPAATMVATQPPAPLRATMPERQAASDRTYANSRQVVLHYEVDSADGVPIKVVELWGSPDQGRGWMKLGDDRDARSPMDATFPADGLWGLRMNVVCAGGPDRTPTPGAAPTAYVEVDTRRPTVAIKPPVHTQDQVRVRWSATDNNLAAHSVRLWYSTSPAGPWEVIASQLANSGEYTWRPAFELDGATVFFRVEAQDMAGNVGKSDSNSGLALRRAMPEISKELPGEGVRPVSGSRLEPGEFRPRKSP